MDSAKFLIALTQNFLQDVKSLLNVQVSDGNQKVLHSIPNKDILSKQGSTSTLMH